MKQEVGLTFLLNKKQNDHLTDELGRTDPVSPYPGNVKKQIKEQTWVQVRDGDVGKS